MSKKADITALDGLHATLAAYFERMLSRDAPLTGAELGQIRQFLKDNNIEVDRAAPRVTNLATKLPFAVTSDDDDGDAEPGVTYQ